MAYNNFTLETVKHQFELNLLDVPFCESLPTAHKIAQIFYKLWVTGGEYSDPGMDYYEQKYHQQILTHLQAKARALGLELIPIEQPPDENTQFVPAPAT